MDKPLLKVIGALVLVGRVRLLSQSKRPKRLLPRVLGRGAGAP